LNRSANCISRRCERRFRVLQKRDAFLSTPAHAHNPTLFDIFPTAP